MKSLLVALLFPVLSLAAGYPPGSYNITGLGPPDWIGPYGYDIRIGLKWDGGSTIDSLAGSFIEETAIQGQEPSCCFSLLAFWPEEFSSVYYPDQPPIISELYIEDGLLAGFHFLHNRHEAIELAADFEAGTYVFDFLWSYQGSRGTLDRAPGYVEDPLQTPEPGAWLLLLTGSAILARARAHGNKFRKAVVS